MVHPFQLLRLLAELTPIATRRVGIHFFDEFIRCDSHLLGEGSPEADPPALALLVELALLGQIKLPHDHRTDLVMQDHRIWVGIRLLRESGNGGRHRGSHRFHHHMHRRVAGLHCL